jgi:chitinase
LLAELRSQLDEAGDYLLTIAAPSSPLIRENIEVELIHQYLDWLNIMTYDLHGPWGGDPDPVTHFNSPLYIIEDDPTPEPYYSSFNMSAAVEGYIAEGVPLEKINASLPFYGRGFDGVPNENNGLFQTYTGPASGGTWEAGVFDYWDLAQNYIDMNGYTSYWNDEAKVPWIYNPNTQKMISYDNPQSMEIKVNYIKSMDLGGTMFWEFSGDKYGVLLNTVYETINTETSVSENEEDSFQQNVIEAFPNPATDIINFNSVNGIESIQVFDYMGKQVFEKEIYNNIYQLNISNLRDGIYILQIKTNDGIAVKKICIEP